NFFGGPEARRRSAPDRPRSPPHSPRPHGGFPQCAPRRSGGRKRPWPRPSTPRVILPRCTRPCFAPGSPGLEVQDPPRFVRRRHTRPGVVDQLDRTCDQLLVGGLAPLGEVEVVLRTDPDV